MKYIIVAGNPLEGFTFLSDRGKPFDSLDDAQAFGDQYILESGDWWVAKLEGFYA